MINGKVIQDKAVEEVLKDLTGDEAVRNLQVLGAKVQDLQYKVPTAPETAGTYVLKATVAADLSVSYAWVAA